MATMIDAGMPMIRSLDTVAAQTGSPRINRLARELREHLEGGSTFVEAISQFPLIFDEMHINLIAAGEASGRLDRIFIRLADFMDEMHRLKKMFISKMIYPVLLLHAAILIMSAVQLFQKGAAAALAYIVGGLGPIYAVVAVLIIGYKVGRKTSSLRLKLDTALYHIPIAHGIVHNLGLARFTGTLETMYSAGVPMIRAFAMAAESTGNQLMAQRIRRGVPYLEEGRPLSEALVSTQVFSVMTNNMIATGEESGRLDTMLEKVSQNAQHEAEVTLERVGIILPGII
jgi:type IV pilus assembly protein PilC